MQARLLLPAIVFFLFYGIDLPAQNFSPVAVTGFNQDVIAEGGPSSLATTTFPLDGVTTSNMIIYTAAFRAFAGFSGGGIPDNGIISDGAGSYQLAPYTGNNALLLQRTQSGDLNFVTPGQYSKLRVLCFSAEGASLVNATVFFTDGSSTAYISNYSLADWFYGTTNTVITGYGRCKRVAGPPYGEEAFPVNPKMYYIEISLSCADQAKTIARINFANSSPGPTGFIYPNSIFFAISGIPYSQTITPVIIPSDCSGPNGSISLNVTGSSGPYSFFWNTNPQQVGATATGLAPGSYHCVIADANGCTTTYDGIVTLNNNATMTAIANPPAICPGATVQLGANVTAPLTTFTWRPGNLPGQSVSVSPTTTTTYTVNASNAIGCSSSAQVTVIVNPVPAAPVINNVTVCSGGNAILQVLNPQTGETYDWFANATGGTPVATGTSYTINNVVLNATYYVETKNASGCTSTTRTPVTIIVNANAALPAAAGITVCPGDDALLQIQNPQPGFTYDWYSAATGGTLLSTNTSYTVNNVNAVTTLYVDAITTNGCPSISRSPVTIDLFQPLATPVVTVSNVSFSSITFSWTAVPGATGYEITTDGGLSYQPPSSGPTGTTHTISGLNGNETVSIRVRASGPQSCQNSGLSDIVSGTTLSSKEIFVPNVFTPNGDGNNDVLYVYGNYVSSIQLNIFNQWGEMIFSSKEMAKGWDGTYKGKQQPVGVYVYTLKVILQDGNIVTKKGSISLIR
ncbi:MAG: gliding motility-associated C-terminal domain-containing protein [Bacteroidota bacterium]|nr:gliding motility-associated C-terminal domain-containing protein [Bacteroidota bacterium]